MRLSDLADDRQAEAKTGVVSGGRGIGLPERLEDVRQKQRVDADAGVVNGDRRLQRRVRQRHDDAAGVGELHGVGQQVPDRLLQPIRIGADEMRRSVDAHLDVKPSGVSRRPHHVDRLFDDLRRVYQGQLQAKLARDDARHVEQIFDEPRLGPGVAVEAGERLPQAIFRHGRHLQNLQPAENGVERRAKFVRHRREKLVLQPVCGSQFVVAPLNLREHVVERDDQLADLVFGDRLLAHRVIAARRDVVRRGSQSSDRSRNRLLESSRKQDGGGRAQQKRQERCERLRAKLGRDVGQVGADIQRSGDAVSHGDRLPEFDRSERAAIDVAGWRRGTSVGERRLIGGEELSLRVPGAGHFDDRQRPQAHEACRRRSRGPRRRRRPKYCRW